MADLHALEQDLNNALPQTQCTQCGYSGCAPYAHAIAFDNVPINQCPPGGQAGIIELARITGRAVTPLNPANGAELPLHIAQIIEPQCIGCTKCIQACPVDAIIGAAKLMHVVLTDVCTGCGLCVPPCPVDCIDMLPAHRPWRAIDAKKARQRFEYRNQRLAQQAEHAAQNVKTAPVSAVEAAMARARARRRS
ncbi:MAG: RnfABCDGE type electron transport complex subunit B [Formosimonas sp.]